MPLELDLQSVEILKHIKLLILDVDGVLTDGKLYYSGQGDELKTFHVRDGLGLSLLMESGVIVAVVTGRCSQTVSARCRELKIQHVYQGALNKKEALHDLLSKLDIKATQIAFMGDDIIDLPILTAVGFPATVKDAHPDILPHIRWQSCHSGGNGAVRELTDLIMQAQNSLAPVFSRLFNEGNIYR